jgi:D-xylose 1-dehydrogenase (NADP+, D-xylono-1,5-lactone-forming)
MTEQVRWGILGYARIAKNEIIPAIQRSTNSTFYAVASRDEDKLKECRELFQCPKTYTDYEELIADPDIQAVYIPLPNSMHKEWALKAMRKGKHVLCEKPIALNAEECLEMIRCSEEQGVLLMEAFMYRFTDRTRKVKEIISSGEIGDVKFIQSAFRFFLNRPNTIKVRPELGGGSLYDVGSYPVNFVGMVMDALPESCSVQAVLENGVDTIFSAVLKYPNGVIANIHSGFNAFPQMSSEVIGTLGRMEIPDTFAGISGTIKVITEAGIREVQVDESDRYALEVQSFANAVLGRKSSLFSLQESLQNMKVIDMLLEQLHK